MKTNCPKKSIAATFFYLENLRKQGVFNATPENINSVVEKLTEIFNGYKENVEKYNRNSKFVVGDTLNFDLITKSTLSSVNFENKISQNIPLTKGQLLSTQHDILLSNENEFPLTDSYHYSDTYSLSYPNLEKNQFVVLSNTSNLLFNLSGMFGAIQIDAKKIIKEAREDESVSSLLSSNAKIYIGNIDISAFEEAATKIETGVAKVAGRALMEHVVTVTPEVINKFRDSNRKLVELEDYSLSSDELDLMQKKLSEVAIMQISNSLIELMEKGNGYQITDKVNSSFLGYFFDYEKMDQKIKHLLSSYTDMSSAERGETIKDADVKDIQGRFKLKTNNIVSFPMTRKDANNNKYTVASSYDLNYEKINKSSPEIFNLHALNVMEIEVTALSASKATFKITELSEQSEPNFFTSQSENLSKSYFYGKDIAKDFSNICIDEADKGISGRGVNIYYAIAKGADNVMVGTGTATEGYASGIVPILGYSGNFTPETIAINTEEFKTLCDKWSIKDSFISELIAGISISKNLSELLKKDIVEYLHSKKTQEGFKETPFVKKSASVLLNELAMTFQHKMDILAQFDLNQISSSLRRLYDATYKMNESKDSSIDLSESSKNILMKVLFSNRNFLKRYPGIANIGTYANQIGSFGDTVNTSIGTRQTILKRKETMQMHDLITYNSLSMNTNDKHKGLGTSDLLATNDIGLMVLSRTLKDYSNENMIPQIKNFLAQNFDFFLSSMESNKFENKTLEKNKKIIISEINNELGRDDITFVDIKNAISKSTSQSVDDANTMYRQALSLDFDYRYFDELLKLSNENLSEESRIVREKKLDIFKGLVSAYRKMFLNKENLLGLEASDASMESIILKSDFGNYALESAIIPTFTRMNGKEMITVNPSELSFSDTTIPEGVKNSIELFLFKDRWKAFTNEKLSLIYKHGNEREEEVLDVFGSKNLEKIIDEEVNNGRNPIIASSRIFGMIANTFDTIASAIKRENKDLPFVLIVNVSDPMAKKFIKNVDNDVLKENNIEIVSVTRTMLDATIKQFAKKDVQMSINSNYQSISRGLDLSMQDSIIAAGAFTNGRELVQFLSRLYSVNKTKAEIYMFNGGEDVSFAFSENPISNLINMSQKFLELSEKEEEDLLNEHLSNMVITTSYSNKLNERGYQKMATNQKFMSGEQTDVYIPSERIIELTSGFEKIIQESTQENDLSIQVRDI